MNENRDYIRQVRRPNSDNFFIIRWGGIILRNIDNETGILVQPCSASQYKEKRNPMWIFLKLQVFKDPEDDVLFPCYQCTECDAMKAVGGLSVNQNIGEINSLKCQHSQVCDFLIGDTWQDEWDLDLNEVRNTQDSLEILLHQEDKHLELRNDNLYLAAVLRDKKISVLFTVNKSQKYPFCSNCNWGKAGNKCKCFKILEEGLDAEIRRILDLDPTAETDKYWEKYRCPDRRPEPVHHYQHEIENQCNRYERYGYNETQFLFPIHRDEDLQRKFQSKIQGTFIHAEEFVPEMSEEKRCCHGNQYAETLLHLSDTITIIKETSETVENISNYGRPTLGDCHCILQKDTHDQVIDGFMCF